MQVPFFVRLFGTATFAEFPAGIGMMTLSFGALIADLPLRTLV
jgi:hypothetical protein